MTVSVHPQAPTCIVGAGLAGVACARELTRAGRAVRVFEAADAPGGRVRTDTVDGFRLDRGFQVFFTAYPETEWFGAAAVRDWRHFRTYRIPWAQFDQSPGRLDPAERDVRLGGGVYVCGDHREHASINGALHAGRRAAEAVLADAGADAR